MWGQSKISGEFRGQSKNFAGNFTLTLDFNGLSCIGKMRHCINFC